VRQIQDYIGFQLLQVHKAHRQRAEASLNKLGIHTGQEMILFQLWIEEGIPQSQLAASMEVEPPTATKMLQRMERAGLIERRPDPEDARVSRVYLTERGRALENPSSTCGSSSKHRLWPVCHSRSRRSYTAC